MEILFPVRFWFPCPWPHHCTKVFKAVCLVLRWVEGPTCRLRCTIVARRGWAEAGGALCKEHPYSLAYKLLWARWALPRFSIPPAVGGHSLCDLFQISILNHHNNSRRYVLALFSFYKETETKEVKKQTKSGQFGSTYTQIEAMQRLAGALDKGDAQIHKAVHVFKTNAA